MSSHSRVHIGFDAKRAFNNATGLGNYSRFVIEGLLKYGDPSLKLHLYTTGIKDPFAGWPGDERALIHRPGPLMQWFPSVWRSLQLTSHLKKDGIRIYHGLSNELPAGIEKSGIRSLVTIHDLIFLRFPAAYKAADRKIYETKFRSACRRADRIIATSKQTRDDIVSYFNTDAGKISVVYQDCHPRFHHIPGRDASDQVLEKLGIRTPYIVCVSAFQQRKNHIPLIQAFASLPDLPHTLVLAGAKGDTSLKVKEMMSRLRLENRVVIIENISSELLPSLYHRADFGVFPSLFEGFGIPLLEALRMQLPMITGNNSCFGEVTGTAGLYADMSDPLDIAAQVKKLAEDTRLRDMLSENTMLEIPRFDPRKLSLELQEEYFKLL